MINQWMHEEWALVATIDPIDANNADTSSDEVDMSKFHQVGVWILLGVLNDSATNTVTVEESATSGGSFTTISGKSQAITGTADGFQYFIGVKSEEMGAGMRYLRATMANSSHSQLTSIAIFGQPRYKPGTGQDLSTVQTAVL